MQHIDFPLRGDYITLDRLLKATGLAGSGGQAKTLVADGKVQVDGRDEFRKTAKLRAGQVVAMTGARVRILPPGPAGDEAGTEAGTERGTERGTEAAEALPGADASGGRAS